ncbi:glycosyltransferase family 4 protein [Methylobacterium sp. WL18]|uniref:glycosyltransferase family 4 protein n=1 Tax=Methylobacterium sp. WL18 TaxID=2603897 RepID=UPI0011CB16AA|nr:glycosyltransferase family 4 protein [Methylobacterium sp. WL18]TXN57126.1 glycosyltransferase family 4 protein [Methylobacterium sp. WL18]
MRILHVLNHTERLNGHVHAAIDLACAQAALGHSVSVASRGGDFDDLLAKNSIEKIILDQARVPLVLIKAELSLLKLVKRFDIVHAHMMTSAVLCWPICILLRRPLITTVHNEFERSAVLMGIGSRVIAVSNAVSESMSKRGVPKSRLRTVLNGTVGSFRLDGPIGPAVNLGSPALLYVAGLHPRKGLPDLLNAFEIVAEIFPAARLNIVGEGPYQAEYQALAAGLRCAEAVVFHGGKDDPRPYFMASDLFVLPSLAEPAGLVLSEACEAGCAIVATNVGGIPEMLDGGNAGMLTPAHDPQNMARAIIRLLSDKSALDHAKMAAKANIPRLKLERVSQETLDIYRECLIRQKR